MMETDKMYVVREDMDLLNDRKVFWVIRARTGEIIGDSFEDWHPAAQAANRMNAAKKEIITTYSDPETGFTL
jgi:hypothetical protein